mgnify:CR=1 FL=1
MKSPTEVLTAIAAALDRLSKWIGRGQAEQAAEQDKEIQAMDKEIQAMKGTEKPWKSK